MALSLTLAGIPGVDPLKLRVAIAELTADCDPSKTSDAAPSVQSAEEYPAGAVSPAVDINFEVPFVVVTTTRIVCEKGESDGVVPEVLNNRYSTLFANKLDGMLPDVSAFAMLLAETIGIIESAKTKMAPKNLLRFSNVFSCTVKSLPASESALYAMHERYQR